MMSKPIDGCAHHDELEDCYLVYRSRVCQGLGLRFAI